MVSLRRAKPQVKMANKSEVLEGVTVCLWVKVLMFL